MADPGRPVLHPPPHVPLQSEILITKFCFEIFLFPEDDAVMQQKRQKNCEEKRDPIIKKKTERHLKQTESQVHRISREPVRPIPHYG